MAADKGFQYSEKFIEMIRDLHKGKEGLPSYNAYIAAHLGGKNSRLQAFVHHLLPELSYRCGDLKSKRVLDFGCGTGATTAALATIADDMVAYDIDAESISICKQRLREHGFLHKVSFWHGDFERFRREIGTFDFILMNGVVEHIPLSVKGLRKRIISGLFEMLRPHGYLYINDTPNRLFPFDYHTTGLWWLPWTSPGSHWAYRRAVNKGKHVESSKSQSPGPLGLEERGVWGATYFEIKKYLSGCRYTMLNASERQGRHLGYSDRSQASFKRRMLETFVYLTFTKWLGIPITCFTSFLSHLVVQKGE